MVKVLDMCIHVLGDIVYPTVTKLLAVLYTAPVVCRRLAALIHVHILYTCTSKYTSRSVYIHV